MGRVKLSVLVLTILVSAFLGACAETPDAKRARHLSRGDEYFGQGRYKDALIEYQNVLRFNASDSRAIERKIGRASCRERGEMSGDEVTRNNKIHNSGE